MPASGKSSIGRLKTSKAQPYSRPGLFGKPATVKPQQPSEQSSAETSGLLFQNTSAPKTEPTVPDSEVSGQSSGTVLFGKPTNAAAAGGKLFGGSDIKSDVKTSIAKPQKAGAMLFGKPVQTTSVNKNQPPLMSRPVIAQPSDDLEITNNKPSLFGNVQVCRIRFCMT